MVSKMQLNIISDIIYKIGFIKNNDTDHYKEFYNRIVIAINDIKQKRDNNELTFDTTNKFIQEFNYDTSNYYECELITRKRMEDSKGGHCYGHYMVK